MEGYVYVRNPGKLVDLMFCSHREAELKAKLGVDQEGLDELEEQLSLLERAGTFWQEETDNQGQILFYTGLYRTSDGTVVPFEPEDEEEDNVESSVGK
jgi:hypothetical protein